MTESRLLIALLALAALFYPLLEAWPGPWRLAVDYPYLLLFAIAMRRGPVAGTGYGFLLGLLRDLADFTQLGATALAFSVAGWALGRLRDKVDREHLGIRLGLLVLGYLLAQALFLLPRSGWSLPAAAFAWLRYALPASLLDALVYLLLLTLVWLLREGLSRVVEPSARG